MTSEEEIVKLRTALAEAAGEIDALKAGLDGDIPRALRWLQGKAERSAPGARWDGQLPLKRHAAGSNPARGTRLTSQ